MLTKLCFKYQQFMRYKDAQKPLKLNEEGERNEIIRQVAAQLNRYFNISICIYGHNSQ